MKMVMNRDIVVSGLSGHAIRFRKDIPTHVPPEMMEDVMAKGAIPAQGQEMPVVEEAKPVVEPVGLQRKDTFFKTFEEFELRNNREDFNAHGVPKAAKMKEELGFHIDAQEVKGMWSEYRNRDKD